MTIVSDLHGVFIDCRSINELRSEVAKKLFGINISPQDFRRSKVIGSGWLLEEQYSRVGKEVYGNWEYVSRMKPINGYQNFNNFVENKNIRLVIVTSVVDEMLVYAKRWLKNHKINFEKVFGVGISGDRTHFLDEFQADVYIDDRIDNLERIQKTLKLPCHKFLMVADESQPKYMVGIVEVVNDLEDLTRELQQL